MEFSNRIKGTVSEALLQAILEDAGYRIIALGVEEILREVKPLRVQQYVELNLPEVVCRLPDFFVADRDLTQWWLMEVKYRRRWEQARIDLESELVSQLRHFSPLHVLICVAESGQTNESNPPAWFRIATLELDASNRVAIRYPSGSLGLLREADWHTLHRVQDIFVQVGDRWPEQTLRKAKMVMQSLRELQILN